MFAVSHIKKPTGIFSCRLCFVKSKIHVTKVSFNPCNYSRLISIKLDCKVWQQRIKLCRCIFTTVGKPACNGCIFF